MSPIAGSLVAIVTPMNADAGLDLEAFRALIDWHVASGTHGIVAVGTTGESPTVNVEEHLSLIEVAVRQAAGRIPVIAGTGANSTAEAIELTQQAHRLGAQASLQVVPYYNKPSQEGLYQHFRAVAEAVAMPHILYNVPGRTVADLSHETTMRLAQISNIIGIKDATGNLERGQWLIREAPQHFSVFSGDDSTAHLLMLMGGGAIFLSRPMSCQRRCLSSVRRLWLGMPGRWQSKILASCPCIGPCSARPIPLP